MLQSPDIKDEPIRDELPNLLTAQQQVAAQPCFCHTSCDVHLLPCRRQQGIRDQNSADEALHVLNHMALACGNHMGAT